MKDAKQNLFELSILTAVLFFFGLAIFLAISNHFKIPKVNSKEFDKMVKADSVIIIDLRETQEIENYPLRYQPLIHLPFLFAFERVDDLRFFTNQDFLLVCSDGNRARLMANILSKRGIRCRYLESGLQQTEIYQISRQHDNIHKK